jgi:hypothetical protein
MRKLLALSLLTLTLLGCERDTTNDLFAQCIADSGAVFYGAFWCPHCQDQKKEFGDSKDLLPYVECDANGKDSQAGLCKSKGVKSYPTWEFPDGTMKSGVLTFEELSTATSCPLPGEESLMVQ